MSDRPTIKRIFSTALAALFAFLLLAPAAQAKDLPIFVEYNGTGHYTALPVPFPPFSPFPPNVVDTGAMGSFGAKTMIILTQFLPPDPPPDGRCGEGPFDFLWIVYTNGVTTFEDGSQIFARGNFADQGWGCLNRETGEFFGEAYGHFVGGAGRFEGASGTFTSPFWGNNLYHPFIGEPGPWPFPEFPMFAIRGWIEGTVTLD